MSAIGESSGASRNLFVLGLNDFHRSKLESLRGAENYRFHGLLAPEDILDAQEYPIRDMIERAEHTLQAFDGPVDGIIGYMDFPVSTMLPILAARNGLRGPSLEAVLKCEHKYWSRLEQQAVVPEHVPPFSAFDPFGPAPRSEIGMDFPFWVKPVKSAGSWLGFRIHDERELDHALETIRENIDRFASPFDRILDWADLPPEIAAIGGRHCLAEGLLSGRQCTLEGHVFEGRVHIHGVVDSIRTRNRSSFARYEYPSALPKKALDRMTGITEAVLHQVGYDGAAFNAEFFWSRDRNRIGLLEINTRVAQHHSDLFEKVDGVSNHQVAVDLALGRCPDLPHREGPFRHAAACFLRRFRDGIVRRVPTANEIRELERQTPGLIVEPHVTEGTRLAELLDQDSYSYVLALLYVGGATRKELLDRYRSCVDQLGFEVADVGEDLSEEKRALESSAEGFRS